MTDKPSIYEALAAVMSDIDHVGKSGWNDHQKFNFRGIDAVVNAVGPALRKHGVIVVPQVISADYEIVQTTTGKASTACRVKVAYIFHGPAGDHIETSVIGEAWDSGDKAAPKAMSVAFRTALLQSLALPTDEPDPDASTFERSVVQDPLIIAKTRVKNVWEHIHKSFDPVAMLADLSAQMGLAADVVATAAELNTYADLLEGKP
jgi:hypothetical protein